MNKRPNPFQPTYQPPQPTPPAHPYPPLPPGPPPGNQQQEWAAYWAQQQAAGAAAYSPHAPQQGWPGQAGPTQPQAQQPAYDPALYRNYGYGGQNAAAQAAWQQARPQAPQAYPPGHPPGYPPYPHAAYAQYPGAPSQPGMPSMSAAPQPMQYGPQYPYPTGPVAMPGQPHAPPPPLTAAMPPPPPAPVGHPQHPAQQHHQPPAKRPRFDSNAQQPNTSIPPRPAIPPVPAQPPPLHFKPGGGMVPASQLNTPGPGAPAGGPGANTNGQRFGAGNNPPRGGGVPLGIPNRGGGQAGRGGRGGGIGAANRPSRGGGPMHAHGGHGGGIGRGGMVGGRGTYAGSGPPMRHDRNRQPAVGPDTSPARAPGIPGLPSSSFNFTPNNTLRGASPFSGTGKRTLTDFRIVGFGVRPIVEGEGDDDSTTLADLDWTWGTIPGRGSNEEAGTEIKVEPTSDSVASASPEVSAQPTVEASPSSPTTKLNRLALSSEGKPVNEGSAPPSPIKSQGTGEMSVSTSNPQAIDAVPPPTSPTVSTGRPTTFKLSSTNSIPVAPRHQRKAHEASRSETSRIRIYFQCPAELDDKDIGAAASPGQATPIKGRTWTVAPSQSGAANGIGVGGKRKKEDDDEDEEREGGKRKREDSSAGSPVKLNDEPAGSEFEVDMQITGMDEESSTPRPLADAEQAEFPQTSTDDFFASEVGQVSGVQTHLQDVNEDYDAYGDPDVDAEGEDMQGFEEWNEGMSWNMEVNSALDGSFDAPGSATSAQELPAAPADLFPIVSGSSPTPHSIQNPSGATEGGHDDTSGNISKKPSSPIIEQVTAVSSPQAEAQTVVEKTAPIPSSMEGINPEMADSVSASESAASTSVAQGPENATSPSSPQHEVIGTDGMEETAHPLKEHEAAPAPAHQASNASRAPLPSPNRISISYAGSARRLVIDADVIESVRIKRGEGRIDVVLLLDNSAPPQAGSTLSTIKEEDHEGALPKVGGGSDTAHGESVKPATDVLDRPSAPLPIVKPEPQDAHLVSPDSLPLTADIASSSHEPSRAQIDALEDSSQTYKPVPHSSYGNDRTIPPFPKYLASAASKPIKLRLLLYLDKEKPLSEPKWVKTGDIEDWLKTMFGPLKTGPQTYASWSGKISIVDPDPPPNVYALVDSWVQHSMVGPPKERRRFVTEHIKTHFDNVFEVLLRIVRRDGSQSNPAPPGSPLATALPANSIHASQQTHASLAVLSLYRLAAEFAVLAGVDGKTLETRVGQLIRSLPQAQVYKSLDSMFKDWMAAQKKPVNSRVST
ncbi:hypothetical protein FRC04_000814 [Tulasnella sp. 424]|nr:hypothetical protein FRC04_000814 [Tulasnella sp. 424]